MEIETRRLLLRPLRDEDTTCIAKHLNDFEVSQFLSRVPFPYSIENAEQFITWQRTFDKLSLISGVCFKADPEKIIGIVSCEHRTVSEPPELGYWLARAFWGQRLMTEAASALVEHVFKLGGIDVLGSGYWNPISGRLLRNLGFTETGEKSSFSLSLNREVRVTTLRLTRSEWHTNNRQKGESDGT
jgi:RimJ/RimL family protein N-acetyltransferase